MPLRIYFFCLTLFSVIIVSSEINLHLTNLNDDNDRETTQHCLHIPVPVETDTDPHQILVYCLSQSPSTWSFQKNSIIQNFTFDQLNQHEITSEQLLRWSAPFDLIERYQSYLDQLAMEKNADFGKQIFYNCSSPRFGPQCQYSFGYDWNSLNDIIKIVYSSGDQSNSLTCYEHLECDRGSSWSCLDWSEICDGHVDCLNDAVDEQHCSFLDAHQCDENEFRCGNGQCIAQTFAHDYRHDYECLDRSDETHVMELEKQLLLGLPRFVNEDVTCSTRFNPVLVKFTSSCLLNRDKLLKTYTLLDLPSSISETCWFGFQCHSGILQPSHPQCMKFCTDRRCPALIERSCPEVLLLPSKPILFGHIYFAYLREQVANRSGSNVPHYLCYDDRLCDAFSWNLTVVTLNNYSCYHPFDLNFQILLGGNIIWFDNYLRVASKRFYHCKAMIRNGSNQCHHSNMYQCQNSSKCISIYRLCDRLNDCPYEDDEQCDLTNNGTCLLSTLDIFFKCTTAKKICIAMKLFRDGYCDCGKDRHGLCEDEIQPENIPKTLISFPTLCDGFTELIPVMIDDQYETDETHCEHWSCDNVYTRCDGYWNCLDGADEINCHQSLCSGNFHPCVSPVTLQMTCLPKEKTNDGHFDCVGATDEIKNCRSDNDMLEKNNFYCSNQTGRSCRNFADLCSRAVSCIWGNSQLFCGPIQNNRGPYSICSPAYEFMRTTVQTFLCNRLDDTQKPKRRYFSLQSSPTASYNSAEGAIVTVSSPLTMKEYQHHCHRGLPLLVWLDFSQNLTNMTCLCPSNYYGDQCQYQNERVSLTLRFQAYSDSRGTFFAIVISLIEHSDQRMIHSSQQLTYLYAKDCHRKFNIYLFYATRPKDPLKNYSIHIDFYEKDTFVYRGSFLFPIRDAFLPVYRLAKQVTIPKTNEMIHACTDLRCIHGRCFQYLNHGDEQKEASFCQCHSGWSGKLCTIPVDCQCSLGSRCLGQTPNNRSICICPLNRWGSRCFLHHHQCQSESNNSCLNGGQCLPMDNNMINEDSHLCLCSKGFSGSRCEITDTKLVINFHPNLVVSTASVLVHFIEVINNSLPENGSTYKKVPLHSRSIIVEWSRAFHIVFLELAKSYYLVLTQVNYQPSSNLSRTISSTDRCPHFNEVVNETFHRHSSLLRRMKYYHIPCRNQSLSLSCFYDDTHFCLCVDHNDQQRVANCFPFNPTLKHDCFGHSNCENGAQCLQDRSICPQTSICVCRPCFYGTRCQFSSSLFALSLDTILGYSIQPKIHLRNQFFIVKISIVCAIIMMIIGIINGVLSLITFQNTQTRLVGCGIYLFGSSITTLLIVIIFSMKFWILLLTQMTSVANRTFLSVQCLSIDFLLRSGLSLDQWLNACVAVERSVATIQGTKFDKKKSQQAAKLFIPFMLSFIVATHLHDPLHRHLLQDDDDHENEHRIWCIVRYSSIGVQTFDFIVNVFHFVVPFLLNVGSAMIIIVLSARQRATVHKSLPRRQLLFQQYRTHRHLINTPLILIILAVPRLVISLMSQCMESSNEPWLLLMGYFICFLPSMLTFVVFVLPSKFYKQEFQKSLRHYQQIIIKKLSLKSYRQ